MHVCRCRTLIHLSTSRIISTVYPAYPVTHDQTPRGAKPRDQTRRSSSVTLQTVRPDCSLQQTPSITCVFTCRRRDAGRRWEGAERGEQRDGRCGRGSGREWTQQPNQQTNQQSSAPAEQRTSRATRESDEERQRGEWQQTTGDEGAHREAERRERRRARGLDGEHSEDSDAQREDTAARKKCRECEDGEREWEPVEEWGSEMLGERVETRDVANEHRLRDTRKEKGREHGMDTETVSQTKGRRGQGMPTGFTPLAPGPPAWYGLATRIRAERTHTTRVTRRE